MERLAHSNEIEKGSFTKLEELPMISITPTKEALIRQHGIC